MQIGSRRFFLSALLTSISSLALPRSTWAQSALRPEQRADYANVFKATRATAQELNVLRDIQERRTSLPAGIREIERFIATSPSLQAMTAGQIPQLGMLMFWHGIVLEATSLDHTTDVPGAVQLTYGEQFGPTRSSRALAIVHLAIFEAVNTITKSYRSYKDIQSKIVAKAGVPAAQITSAQTSIDRAIVEAAFDSLVAMFPGKRAVFESARVNSLPRIGDAPAKQNLGEVVGKAAAEFVLKERENDRSQLPDLSADDFEGPDPLGWRKDEIVPLPPALGGNWHRVKPFVIASADKYRPAPPPQSNSPEFIAAFKEVKALGGDPSAPTMVPRWPTQTRRTGTIPGDALDANNETFKGIFWAYDGTALLCAPPRLYNMVATSIASKEKPITTVSEMARFLALINVAMADAGIGAWEAKYHYAYARPIAAIRRMGVDASPEGRRDPNWTPLGAPVSNGDVSRRNLTPPFPAYPSGHATFGGALFQVMRRFWSLPMDGVKFEFLSDEYNGQNRGPGDERPRPVARRTYETFTQAEEENGRSRIWLGIHWNFDATSGIEQGRRIADDVFQNILQPV